MGGLLKERTARESHKMLSMMGEVIVPSLSAVVDDPRFHLAEWPRFEAMTPAPLEAVLGLLVANYADELVLKTATALSWSTSEDVRKIAGEHLASLGRSEAIPTLSRLMQDEDVYVREWTHRGMQAGFLRRRDTSFQQQAYNLLLKLSDQLWAEENNEISTTLAILDPSRAAADFSSPRLLTRQNPNLPELLKASVEQKIPLPVEKLQHLLEDALSRMEGEIDYLDEQICVAILKLLALQLKEESRPLLVRMLSHPVERIRGAAVESLAILAGVEDPYMYVLNREEEVSLAGLSFPQCVVRDTIIFDGEIGNGGLMQFLGNSSGNRFAETRAALQELERFVLQNPDDAGVLFAEKWPKRTPGGDAGTVLPALKTLESMAQIVGPQGIDRDRDTRLSALGKRYEQLEAAFRPLEEEHDRSSIALRQVALLYAARNAEHFKPTSAETP